MHYIIISAAIAAATFLAPPAFAADGQEDHRTPPPNQISAETMKQKMENLGYDVQRLEIEHGNFEVHLIEKNSGGAVKALFHGVTGELVRAELRE